MRMSALLRAISCLSPSIGLAPAAAPAHATPAA